MHPCNTHKYNKRIIKYTVNNLPSHIRWAFWGWLVCWMSVNNISMMKSHVRRGESLLIKNGENKLSFKPEN